MGGFSGDHLVRYLLAFIRTLLGIVGLVSGVSALLLRGLAKLKPGLSKSLEGWKGLADVVLVISVFVASYQLWDTERGLNERDAAASRGTIASLRARADSVERTASNRAQAGARAMWSLDHPVRVSCRISPAQGQDSLIVENGGFPLAQMSVDWVTLFEVQPTTPAGGTRRVGFAVPDYFGSKIAGDFEGSSRVVYGVSGRANRSFVEALRWRMADTLRSWHVDWAYIGTRRGARVKYWDELGTRAEIFFFQESMDPDGLELVRISAARWRQVRRTSDSLVARHQVLSVRNVSVDEAVGLVAQACARSVGRSGSAPVK